MRAALWQGSVVFDVNRLLPPQGSSYWQYLEIANDVSDAGLIVGDGSYYFGPPYGYARASAFVLTPPAFLKVVSPLLSQQRMFSFNVLGQSGLVCTIEATTSLSTPAWASLGTVTLNGGSAVFTDNNAPGYSVRFYRVKSGNETSGDVVGFQVRQVPAGYSMVSCPFEMSDNRVPAAFDGAPDFTGVSKWDDSTQAWRINSKGPWGWVDRLMTADPGEGLVVNTTSAFELRFWGRVQQNCPKKPVGRQLSVHGSMAALSGGVWSALKFPVANGENIYRMTGTDGSYTIYTYWNNTWSPSEPIIGLGEAFWVNKDKPTTWRQNYSAW